MSTTKPSTASSLNHLSRRTLPKLGIAGGIVTGVALGGWASSSSTLGQTSTPGATPDVDLDQLLAATPAIADDDEPTLEQAEGPYFTTNTPERTNLREEGVVGTMLTVAGFVVGLDGAPVPATQIEFWQADGDGVYDNEGYRLRGHQLTDDEGRFILETVMPGLYPGRTRHIHVMVQAPGRDVLTTQLYFPDEPSNAEDRIYDESLELEIQPEKLEDGAAVGLFTFVLDLS
ncbi:MAG: dioxygenase [Chloroflexia bacterium]|nr:dioxygenase [Chloroflexia bacterium]